jgi:hypothetical protein
MRTLNKSEKYLCALLVDIVAMCAFCALGLADKVSPTTAATAIAGIVLARKPPVDVDDDDNDNPSGGGKRRTRQGLKAVSGILTMCLPLFWAWDWVRTRTA